MVDDKKDAGFARST